MTKGVAVAISRKSPSLNTPPPTFGVVASVVPSTVATKRKTSAAHVAGVVQPIGRVPSGATGYSYASMVEGRSCSSSSSEQHAPGPRYVPRLPLKTAIGRLATTAQPVISAVTSRLKHCPWSRVTLSTTTSEESITCTLVAIGDVHTTSTYCSVQKSCIQSPMRYCCPSVGTGSTTHASLLFWFVSGSNTKTATSTLLVTR